MSNCADWKKVGRIVDPGAGNVVVIIDGELPWASVGTSLLVSVERDAEHAKGGKSVRKRDRASSHDSHRSRSSSNHRAVRSSSHTAAGGAAGVADSSPSHRAKRSRTAGSVTSLLERLTQVDASMGNVTGGAAAASASGAVSSHPGRSAARASALQYAHEEAAAAASLVGGVSTIGTIGGRFGADGSSVVTGGASSLFSTRYRSAMESMLRSSPPGVSSSAGARGDRDGSLSRILASSAGGPGGGGLSRSPKPAQSSARIQSAPPAADLSPTKEPR